MSETIREYHRRIVVYALLSLTALGSGQAAAIPAEDRPGDGSGVQALTVLQTMRGHIESGRLDQALALLDALSLEDADTRTRLEAHHMIGYVYQRKGEYGRALEHYQRMLEHRDAMAAGLLAQTRYTAAQLSFALADFEQAVEHLRAWQRLGGSSAAGPYILLGQAYFKVGDYPRAIRSLETGISRAERQGQTVREDWLRLLQYLQAQRG
ncbi:MAG: tetratricopeptide repeat protein [Gammaproteobacteria bacterium]|nr:tetratricopeptide repeat protein [Gammaproteobacteria bacterium]